MVVFLSVFPEDHKWSQKGARNQKVLIDVDLGKDFGVVVLSIVPVTERSHPASLHLSNIYDIRQTLL